MNNKNTNKTLLMLSIISMILIPGGIIPVYAVSGNQLLTINNPTQVSGDQFSISVIATFGGV